MKDSCLDSIILFTNGLSFLVLFVHIYYVFLFIIMFSGGMHSDFFR